jgi:hypothetical protein
MVETMAEARNRPLPLPPLLLLLPHSIVAHQLSNLQRLPALRKHASMPKRTTSKKQLWRHRAAASPICQALRQQHTRIIEVEVEVVSMRRRVSTFILHPLQAPRHLRHHLLHREEPQYVVVSMSVSLSLSLSLLTFITRAVRQDWFASALQPVHLCIATYVCSSTIRSTHTAIVLHARGFATTILNALGCNLGTT